MLIWKNTATLDGFDEGLNFTNSKKNADIALLGGKPIDIDDFPNLKGIFRAGISTDNVPIKEAKDNGIIVRFPSLDTINIIYEETASFTCGLIFRMLYNNVGDLDAWQKEPRIQLSNKILLIIGTGRIGKRVAKLMKNFMTLSTYDIIQNDPNELQSLISKADCISLHIPKTAQNVGFIDEEKLSWMKTGSCLINTARGPLVDEDALYKEIKSGRLKAAFDVYWNEPYEGKLKEFYPYSYYMTPHVASTCSGFLDGCRIALDELISDIQSEKAYSYK